MMFRLALPLASLQVSARSMLEVPRGRCLQADLSSIRYQPSGGLMQCTLQYISHASHSCSKMGWSKSSVSISAGFTASCGTNSGFRRGDWGLDVLRSSYKRCCIVCFPFPFVIVILATLISAVAHNFGVQRSPVA